MNVRGTINYVGEAAAQFRRVTDSLRETVNTAGYQEFIPSILAPQEIFVEKAGQEILRQMYAFPDRKGRQLCLIPEVTAVVQQLYRESWEKSAPKPVKLFYLTRCYRYERPQTGRYREFFQFGVENLGGKADKRELIDLLDECLKRLKLQNYTIEESVKRGLDYYVEDGFEASCSALGAQKQIAGGGRYDCGIGWAIGVERLLLALDA
jgi:histidyl-tRNA synthetase